MVRQTTESHLECTCSYMQCNTIHPAQEFTKILSLAVCTLPRLQAWHIALTMFGAVALLVAIVINITGILVSCHRKPGELQFAASLIYSAAHDQFVYQSCRLLSQGRHEDWDYDFVQFVCLIANDILLNYTCSQQVLTWTLYWTDSGNLYLYTERNSLVDCVWCNRI